MPALKSKMSNQSMTSTYFPHNDTCTMHPNSWALIYCCDYFSLILLWKSTLQIIIMVGMRSTFYQNFINVSQTIENHFRWSTMLDHLTCRTSGYTSCPFIIKLDEQSSKSMLNFFQYNLIWWSIYKANPM